jgi:hypothetical protein
MITKIKKNVKKYKDFLILTSLAILIFGFGFSLGIIYGGKIFARPPIIIEKDLLWEKEDFEIKENQREKYVASKKGKYYYPINCPLANNLSESNKIYFFSKEEAEAQGYIYQSKCESY